MFWDSILRDASDRGVDAVTDIDIVGQTGGRTNTLTRRHTPHRHYTLRTTSE